MPLFFSDPDNITDFSFGFDLVGGYLPEQKIADIITEIGEELKTDPGIQGAALALDALYNAIGDPDAALDALTRENPENWSSLFKLRQARQLMNRGDKKEAEDLLHEVIREEMETSLVRQLCACLAHARLNDPESFTRSWKRLLLQYEIIEPASIEDFKQFSEEYSLLEVLPFQEHIEGLGYLFRYHITDQRDAELFSLIACCKFYLEDLLIFVTDEISESGATECQPAFGVIQAISQGAAAAAEEALAREDAVADEAVRENILASIHEIRNIGTKMFILDTLMDWSFHPVTPVDLMLSALRGCSGGDDELVFEMLELVSNDLPPQSAGEILSALSAANPDNVRMIRSQFYALKSGGRYWDALAIADQHGIIGLEGESYEELKLNALRSSGSKEEVFGYLLDRISKKQMLGHSGSLFELAISLGRVADVLAIKSVFEAKKVKPGLYLVSAYEHMKKRDVNGGMDMIKRARGAGLTEDQALYIAAGFLLLSGYPKRVIGLCEKMQKRLRPPEDVYPLLIAAYREQGQENEARASEEALLKMTLGKA